MRRKPLRFEQCEPRLALSATGLIGETELDLSLRSISGLDDTTRRARDLGTLEATATIRNQYVGPFDHRDVFRFELERGTDTTIRLDGLSADADIYLLNSRRQTVAASDRAGNRAETIDRELPAGEYFVVVQNYNAWQGTRYVLSLQGVATAPDGAGNSFAQAQSLGSIQNTTIVSDFVGQQDDIDVYRFDVESPSRFQSRLDRLQEDVDLHLYSSRGRKLLTADRSGTSPESINARLAAGSYYLVVDAYESANSDYRMTLLTTPIAVQETPSTPSREPVTTTPAADQPAATPTTDGPTSSDPLSPVPFFGSTAQDWGVNAVNAPEAWAAGHVGQGVTVAIIDSGVQTNHPDLFHSIWVNPGEIAGDGIDNDGNGYVDDIQGWDFVGQDNNPDDENGHGTHVAGIVAAANNGVGGTGVAYASNIMPIRVLDADGSGSTNGVARGIRYAVDNGAQIINLSLGGGNSSNVYSALRYAEQNNVLVVAASGNENANVPGYPAAHSATLSNVLSVGAHNSRNQRSTFSNRVGNSRALQIDAPGQSIFSTLLNGRYGSLSGTSMATPFVSGVAALIAAANPTLSASIIRNAITLSANSPSLGSDSLGRIDAAAAIPLASSGRVTPSPLSSAALVTSNRSSQARVQLAAVDSVTNSRDVRDISTDNLSGTRRGRFYDLLVMSSGVQNQPEPAATTARIQQTIEPITSSMATSYQVANETAATEQVFAEEDWHAIT